MADLFAVQDEMVRTIAGTVAGRVYVSTAEHLRRTPPSSLEAYDLTMRANWLSWNDPTTRAEAKRCFAEAIDLDPGYGLPHSLLALLRRGDWHRDLSEPRQTLDEAFALAMRGVELAENDCNAHGALSLNYLDRRAARPAVSIDKVVERLVFANDGDSEHLAACLRLAGLPETGATSLVS